MNRLDKMRAGLESIMPGKMTGRVSSVGGLDLVCKGFGTSIKLGDHLLVNNSVRGEVVAIKNEDVSLLPFGTWEGISPGDPVTVIKSGTTISPTMDWIGRVVDAFGHPMDELELVLGGDRYPLRSAPPDPFLRRSVGQKMETAVKAIDVFIPICRGQRLGIFAGSGVGKSTLMGMLARQAQVDVIVMGLVGERGREVRDFIRRDLGEDGMARSVLVVATSDQPALQRRQAAWTATAIAEYFRDQGLHVLLMLDSVTRFAMAQREIGLAAGEPPTTKGYTPTVFTELPRLLERSGPGCETGHQGDITAVYTVLVDGDDMNEPIADAVRGILDGHIALDRKIAERGRYPAINVQKSISRMLPYCHTKAELQIMNQARAAMAKFAEMEDLIRIGAYRPGSNEETDMQIAFSDRADRFLGQGVREPLSSMESFAALYGEMLAVGMKVELGSG